jgi:hypothetical protein
VILRHLGSGKDYRLPPFLHTTQLQSPYSPTPASAPKYISDSDHQIQRPLGEFGALYFWPLPAQMLAIPDSKVSVLLLCPLLFFLPHSTQCESPHSFFLTFEKLGFFLSVKIFSYYTEYRKCRFTKIRKSIHKIIHVVIALLICSHLY